MLSDCSVATSPLNIYTEINLTQFNIHNVPGGGERCAQGSVSQT